MASAPTPHGETPRASHRAQCQILTCRFRRNDTGPCEHTEETKPQPERGADITYADSVPGPAGHEGEFLNDTFCHMSAKLSWPTCEVEADTERLRAVPFDRLRLQVRGKGDEAKQAPVIEKLLIQAKWHDSHRERSVNGRGMWDFPGPRQDRHLPRRRQPYEPLRYVSACGLPRLSQNPGAAT